MTLTAFYRGRLVWCWDGPTFPDIDLEPIGRGWTYALGESAPLGREALRLSESALFNRRESASALDA